MQLRTILSFFHFIILAFLLEACDQPVSILDIESESELVVYAFPTTDDEYLLNISLSQPVEGTTGTLHIEYLECTTNGRPDEVTLVREETHFGMPMAIFRVKGEHRSGDKISIIVRDVLHHEATASTTIPAAMPMDVTCIDTIRPKLRFLLNVHPSVTDDAYYATRLTAVWKNTRFDKTPEEYGYKYDDGPDEVYHSWNWVNFAPISYDHLSIDPSLEPLLNHYSDLNLDPWDEYYQNMYFFSSDDVRASSQSSSASVAGGKESGVVLHLQTEYPGQMNYIDVQFYTLSREYYLMLRQINDQLSNELAEAGLSQTYSTYSNVRGGFGCVAAYACTHYTYTPPAHDEEQLYW